MNLKKRANSKYSSIKKSGQSVTSKNNNFTYASATEESDVNEGFIQGIAKYVKTNIKTILIVVISMLLICALTQLDKTRKHLVDKSFEFTELQSKYDAIVNSTNKNEVTKILEMITTAANATLTTIYSTNDKITAGLEELARTALTRDTPFCNAYLIANITESTAIKWCLRDINSNLLLDLEDKYTGNWTVTVGQLNRCFTTRNFGATHRFIFHLNDVLFEFLEYDEEFTEISSGESSHVDELDALKKWIKSSENKV